MLQSISFRQDGYPESQPRICDICQGAACTVYCQDESAYLCHSCDEFIHAYDPSALFHQRVLICNACENAQAAFACQAHGASLCINCDIEIHLANPLTCCHNRYPLPPFPAAALTPSSSSPAYLEDPQAPELDMENQLTSGLANYEELENELESWFLFDLDDEQNTERLFLWQNSSPTDYQDQGQDNHHQNSSIHQASTGPEVLESAQFTASNEHQQHPVQLQQRQKQEEEEEEEEQQQQQQRPLPPAPNQQQNHSEEFQSSKAASVNTTSTQKSLASSPSSLEPGNVLANARRSKIPSSSTPEKKTEPPPKPPQLGPFPFAPTNREAKVLRYREKKKARQFDKKIRYQSRKANAQNRPRVKGRFVRKSDLHFDVDTEMLFAEDHICSAIFPLY